MAEKITFDDLREKSLFATMIPGHRATELFTALVDVAERAVAWEQHPSSIPDTAVLRNITEPTSKLIVAARDLRDLMEPKPCRHSWCCYRGEDGKQFAECPKPGCGARIDLPEVGDDA